MLGMDKKSARNGTNTVETLIGPRVVIRGDVQFSGGLYIEGRIIGKISAEEGSAAVLTLSEQGFIDGEVHVPVVVIAGNLHGDIHASERIELSPSAKIQGNIHYKVVEMAAGATLTGRLIHADALVPEETQNT